MGNLSCSPCGSGSSANSSQGSARNDDHPVSTPPEQHQRPAGQTALVHAIGRRPSQRSLRDAQNSQEPASNAHTLTGLPNELLDHIYSFVPESCEADMTGIHEASKETYQNPILQGKRDRAKQNQRAWFAGPQPLSQDRCDSMWKARAKDDGSWKTLLDAWNKARPPGSRPYTGGDLFKRLLDLCNKQYAKFPGKEIATPPKSGTKVLEFEVVPYEGAPSIKMWRTARHSNDLQIAPPEENAEQRASLLFRMDRSAKMAWSSKARENGAGRIPYIVGR